MTAETAFRTGRIGSDADAMPEVLEKAAVAGTELGEGYALAAGKRFLRAVNGRGARAKQRVRAEVVDDFEYRVCVEGFDCFFVFRLRKNAVGEEGVHHILVFRKKSVFHTSGTGISSDDLVGAVVWSERRGEVLGSKEVGVGLQREFLHLLVEVGDGGGPNAASRHAEGRILDQLKSVKG